jgi:superfamily II DNA or RNA helicase
MSNLKDLFFEKAYSSDEDNLLKKFYMPSLSIANEYYRLTGYFSSSLFGAIAEGIGEFIKNDGKIKLITGSITARDASIAEDMINNQEILIKEFNQIIEEAGRIQDAFIQESLKAFAWMLAKGLLEIKVAIPKKQFKDQYDYIFHEKVGILSDKEGNSISFSGSINETLHGWYGNIEEFKVFKNWDNSEKKYFEKDKIRFTKLWENLTDQVEVIPLARVIQEKLIEFAPDKKEDIDFSILSKDINTQKIKVQSKQPLPKVRDYQQKAIDAWKTKNFKGILSMATGTGKTLIGLKIIECEKGISIIVCPTKEICSQWKEGIESSIETDELIMVSSSESTWKKRVESSLHHFKRKRISKIVVISTYASLQKLLAIISKENVGNLFLLADEVHSFGAEKISELLVNQELSRLVSKRLGLSATPERLYDSEGNKKIENFFGGIIFRYTIGEAIKDKVLCPYFYHLKVVEMSDDELKKYISLTSGISRAMASSKNGSGEDYTELLLNKRAKILKSSKNKLPFVKSIVSELKKQNDIKQTLIFSIDTNQLMEVKQILTEQDISSSEILGPTTDELRKSILFEFVEENIEVLLSIKILDEGINLNKVKNAIILASSANPREYVQRRGRVLRQNKTKDKIAKIFDFIVVSKKFKDKNTKYHELEQKIIKKELERALEFVKYSENKLEFLRDKNLSQLIRDYDLSELYTKLRVV